jgi:hypothetical protein
LEITLLRKSFFLIIFISSSGIFLNFFKNILWEDFFYFFLKHSLGRVKRERERERERDSDHTLLVVGPVTNKLWYLVGPYPYPVPLIIIIRTTCGCQWQARQAIQL